MKFKSKIDNKQLFAVIFTVALNLILVILFLLQRKLIVYLAGIVLMTGLNALIFIPRLLDTSYTLTDDYICIKSWILLKLKVPYKDVISIKTAQKRMTSAALSKDRLELKYFAKGKEMGVLISPVKKKVFVAELSKRVQEAKSFEKKSAEERP